MGRKREIMAIEKAQCVICECDNCGDLFDNGQFSIFPDESRIKEEMSDCEWFVGHPTDKDHANKYYCPKCFTCDEEVDDLIHIVESRKKHP